MILRHTRACGLLMLVALSQAPTHAAPPPAEHFFQKPQVDAAALSPDGWRIAMRVASKDTRARLAVLDLKTMKGDIVSSFGGADIGSFHWVNEQRLVFDAAVELTGPNLVDFAQGLYAVNADGSNFRELVASRSHFLKDPADPRELLPWDTWLLAGAGTQRGDHVWVVTPGQRDRNGIDFIKLQRLNTVNGRSEEIEAPPNAFDWILDGQGELRSVVTHKDHRTGIHLRQPGGPWKLVTEHEELGSDWLRPRFMAPDGTLFAEAPAGRTSALYTIDTATGQRSAKPVLSSKDFDLHLGFIASDQKLLGLRYTVDAPVTQWLDPALDAVQKTVDTLLPGTINQLDVPRRGDSPWVLVRAFSDAQPPLYLAFHTGTRQLTRLGGALPAIDPRQMGSTDFVRIAARDGRTIPAYLTLPPGATKKNLPMVVLLHGGPWIRGATWRFDAEVQFLATRGYAVLQPEFRGSTGYGADHFEAGFKQWGRAMQDDVADATRWAIAQGHADPRRVCLAGASYGGYATLMGLARDPDLYRCGVQWVGVTDIELMYTVHWSDLNNRFKAYGMPRMIGDPVKDADLLKAASPLQNASKIRQPLLMAYGAWDTRVPLVHGEKFLAAVKPHNPEVEWVVYPNEGHGWARVETRLDFWGRVEKFLARQLAP